MKSIVIIYLFVLALTNVANGADKESRKDILKKIATTKKKHASINGVFKPSKKGFLGEGSVSIVYKGKFLPKRMEVAMKFTNNKIDGECEYRMYTYLDAIDKPDKPNVEAYGIPTIYYYGMWYDYFIMAMTLLDPEFQKRFSEQKINEIDLLILFREFVRITKYIHSRGVFHNHITYTNIMFRKHQCFIYDFNIAVSSTPETTRERKLRAAKNDWHSFLRGMFFFIKYPRSFWSWLELSESDDYDVNRMDNSNFFASSLKEDSETNDPHKFSGLRKVFVEFAKYAYGNDSTCTATFYDDLYQIIVEEIKQYAQRQKKQPIPSWLSNAQEEHDAVLAIDTIPSISSIRDPFASDGLEHEEVNYGYFSGIYPDQQSSSGESESSDLRKRFGNFLNCAGGRS